ncbi:hypothetical protein FB451DRAFT_1386132 [Mycena latifolia]|nr:hypothetical protein FB451DRAFT_1386132 [Mycena latifolia]
MQNPTTSTIHKRPFQDITDRFISPARPKRKPKTPGGTLGEKLRLRVIETAKSPANVFPSSLPPSSPPLYSSSSRGVPLLSSEGEVAREMQGADDDEAYAYGRDDFGTMMPSDDDADEDAENRAPTNLSDPFGFFAVERRLKAERAVQPLQPAPLRASRSTDDKERDDGRVMPSTPHKPKPGKRRLSAAADALSPAATSGASTPSPVKPGEGLRPRASLDTVDMDTNRELFPAQPTLVDNDDGDDGAPPRRKKRRPSPEVALPPRRSTRAPSKAEKDVAKPQPKARAKKAPTKTRAAGKKKATENNDLDDDQQEKFEAERQARLEYFRKLEDYSFEKENVYVV